MFHRPKMTEEQQTEEAAQQPRATERPPIKVYAGQRPLTGPAITQNNSLKIVNAKPETKPEEQSMSNEEQAKQPARPIEIPGASSYQPQPARAPGSVFGSGPYPGIPGQAPKAPQGRRLVIGEGITLSGEIEACEYLVIEGNVEAALKGASVLEIAESGTFYGTVEINEATVAGRFEGEITCNGRLTITATGSVTGTISYKELAIEAGATLDGKVNPLSGSKAAATGKKSSDKSVKVKGQRNDNADDGGELPLTGSGN
jgi:cytoskeletal protein CcmA (bactofilin family)